MRGNRGMLAALAVAGLLPLAGTATAAAPKTAVCHLDRSAGVFLPISVADAALPAHLDHGDSTPRGDVPGMAGYVFTDGCVPVHRHVVNFDDISFGGSEYGPLGSYAGFAWGNTYVYRPTITLADACGAEILGYCTGSSPNVGFVGFPSVNPSVTATAGSGDVSFTSVFLTNPGRAGGDSGNLGAPITVTITARDDGAVVGTITSVLDAYAGRTVALDSAADAQRFESVDSLTISAGGKYFGFDDLTYYAEP